MSRLLQSRVAALEARQPTVGGPRVITLVCRYRVEEDVCAVELPDSSTIERQPGESVEELRRRAEAAYRPRAAVSPVMMLALRYRS